MGVPARPPVDQIREVARSRGDDYFLSHQSFLRSPGSVLPCLPLCFISPGHFRKRSAGINLGENRAERGRRLERRRTIFRCPRPSYFPTFWSIRGRRAARRSRFPYSTRGPAIGWSVPWKRYDPKDHNDGMMNPSGRFQTPSRQELTTQ